MNETLRQAIRQTYRDKNVINQIFTFWPRCNPYIFDFIIPLTPIERNVWHNIRCLGLPFFMQFPVLGYFVDFADPVMKLGIEADGKEWHRDIEKDRSRQQDIERLGWTIYRIQGSQTFTTLEDFLSQDEYDEIRGNYEPEEADLMIERKMSLYHMTSSEGILQLIKEKHYGDMPQRTCCGPVKIGEIIKGTVCHISM